jgi:hypothetical protein
LSGIASVSASARVSYKFYFLSLTSQYYDLLKILKEKGRPSETNFYLFNGDIVDKGPKSVECILLLFCLKVAFPEMVRHCACICEIVLYTTFVRRACLTALGPAYTYNFVYDFEYDTDFDLLPKVYFN